MHLKELLKRIREIEPDATYATRSRHLIMGGGINREEPVALSPWQIFLQSLQFGSAIALFAVLLILIVGGFSTWKFLSPLRLTGLEPTSLEAEAQAVDIQIQLTDIVYSEPLGLDNKTSTSPYGDEVKKQAENLGIKTTPPKITIDEALDLLSQ